MGSKPTIQTVAQMAGVSRGTVDRVLNGRAHVREDVRLRVLEAIRQSGYVSPFVRRVRETYPQKTVWAFSGFTLEELRTEGSHPRCEATDELLSMLDVLVDGRFVEALKDISLRFRGSSNQRLIDMKNTLASGEIVLLPDLDRKPGQV